ncbi:MAG: FAD-dependent oxidoreductase [Eubacteriales bacterium]|nr:FAD-dependent oxidoreductase [Eubacteriales bacterium]
MKTLHVNLLIIGGGPAGLAAAYGAYQAGERDILIVERDNRLGGILNQCIHNGFGLHRFKEELSGPEYAQRYIDMLKDTSVKVLSDTMVLDLSSNKVATISSFENGLMKIEAKAVILAMGCRERSRGAISTPGDRVAGIYTAGAAQKYCNIDGYLVGKRIVILGSGDIGLIMARRMTLEGAKVLADVELCPYSNGLARNIAQCLNDFDIPLYLSYTVTDIIADKDHKRVSKVVISKVDEKRNPIPGSEISFDCDTLLLSVGLIPENELSKKAGVRLDRRTKGAIVKDNLETSIEGIFACGNVLQVHDLVDNVSAEGEKAGRSAAEYIKEGEKVSAIVSSLPGEGLGYLCPQILRKEGSEENVDLFFRVRTPLKQSVLEVYGDGKLLKRIPKIRLVPSEMESVRLKRSELAGLKEVSVVAKEVTR